MTDVQQGRASESTPVPVPAFTPVSAHGEPAVSAPAVAYVRLWAEAPANGASLWKSSQPAVGLALDIIRSCKAEPQTSDGSVFLAEFPTATQAMLAGRRLQWAFQGLSEQEAQKHSGVAVLVCANSEVCSEENAGAIGDALSHALESAAPGQILLSRAVAQAFTGLAGVSLGEPSAEGWKPFLWQRPSPSAAATVDEEHIRTRLQKLGKIDPAPATAVEPKPDATINSAQVALPSRPISASRPTSASRPVSASRPITAATRAATTSQTPLRTTEHPASQPFDGDPHTARQVQDDENAGGNKRTLIFGGIAAAVLLAIGIAFMAFHHKSEAAPSPTAGQTTPSAPQNSPTTPAGPQQPAKPSPAVATTKKQPKSEPKTPPVPTQVPLPKPVVVASNCDLTEGEIPRTLQRAENDMHAGRLDEAKDAFTRLRGCPTARDRAEEGLRLTLQRIEAQK